MTIHPALAAAACGALFLVPPTVGAQTTPASGPLQTVVVTAARLPQVLAQVPLDVRVIPRDVIDRAGVASLADLLQQYAGVEVSATGGAGQTSAVFLRGSNSNHVVVLVDGVRLNAATSGTTALEHLPLAQIDRIEVLQGPASALYGADAIGGVIQIFTRRDDSVQASLGLGSDGTRALSGGFGHRQGDTFVGLQAGWRETTRGGSATNADNVFSYDPDTDAYRVAHLGGSVEQRLAPGHHVTLQALLSDSLTHFDAGAGSDDRMDQRLSTVSLRSRHALGDDLQLALLLARGSDHAETLGAFPGRFSTDQDQASATFEWPRGPWQAAAGLEWRRESVDSDTAFTVDQRRIASVFGSLAGDLGAQQVQLALRHDRNSQFGGRSTVNGGWQWMLAPGWQLRAAAGTAFKAPSFNDLYYPLSFGYAGNPDLAPERSRSAEIGLRRQAGAWSASATVFDQRIRGLIAINDDFSSVANVARATIRGLTLSGQGQAGCWALRADATWQRPRNTDSDTWLVRRAQRHASAGIDWTHGDWRLGAEWVGVGHRFDDAANSDAARLGGYGLLNLSAGWTWRPGWTLSARLDNAADRAYTLVRGYDPEGRRLFVSLAWDGR